MPSENPSIIPVGTGRQQRLLIEDRHALEPALEERAAGLLLAVGQPRKWLLQAFREPAQALQPIAHRRDPPGVLQPCLGPLLRDRGHLLRLVSWRKEASSASHDVLIRPAPGHADYYLEDAEIALVTREEGGLKFQTQKGRAEIEKFYADIFKEPETIKSRNTVEYAKLIAPDVLVIAGTFDTNTLKPDSPKVPFYQVRVKKGDQWLMSSVRIFVLPRK